MNDYNFVILPDRDPNLNLGLVNTKQDIPKIKQDSAIIHIIKMVVNKVKDNPSSFSSHFFPPFTKKTPAI